MFKYKNFLRKESQRKFFVIGILLYLFVTDKICKKMDSKESNFVDLSKVDRFLFVSSFWKIYHFLVNVEMVYGF